MNEVRTQHTHTSTRVYLVTDRALSKTLTRFASEFGFQLTCTSKAFPPVVNTLHLHGEPSWHSLKKVKKIKKSAGTHCNLPRAHVAHAARTAARSIAPFTKANFLFSVPQSGGVGETCCCLETVAFLII